MNIAFLLLQIVPQTAHTLLYLIVGYLGVYLRYVKNQSKIQSAKIQKPN